MLKLKVSGAYLKDGSSTDYEFNDIFMPDCPEEWIQLNAMKRAVPMRLTKAGKQFDFVRSCYIDAVKKLKDDTNNDALAFKAKSIKDYTHEDCQNCAISFQLLNVPIYRSGDLREARQKTYVAYLQTVLGEKIEQPFNYSVAPNVYVDSQKHANIKTMSNTELLNKISES